jgi:desulfoferrodoxin-like iron-binding protein
LDKAEKSSLNKKILKERKYCIKGYNTLQLIKILIGKNMAVETVGQKFVCSVCGNEIEVTKAGGGTITCCGQDMQEVQ